MFATASTSALRVSSKSLCHSLPAVAVSRRCLSSTITRWAEQEDDHSTPARAHRQDTPASRIAGGTDVNPVNGSSRNSSTEAAKSARLRGADKLATLAERLTTSDSISSLSSFDMPEMASPPTVATSGFAAPSGYTTETLPLKTDPTLEAFVNNLMKDGKKASATRHILDMMQYLAKALHADPLPAVRAAIEAAGPLVRMQSRKSGGKNVAVPMALGPHQSRRKAIVAIIAASKKRSEKQLSVRLAREIIAVLEGSSSTLQKKEEAHRLAMVNRSNTSVRI
ncbi:hypothetical protein CBS101457_000807 [Exobasidium rhododendri]|nr:hypothetical protein CBS101457_000807 [Exobasidium rhododendri]